MSEDQIVEIGARGAWPNIFRDDCPRQITETDRKAGRDAVRAALAALREAGLVVVPVEPTEAMKWAALRLRESLSASCLSSPRDHEVYRAMIRAVKEPTDV